MESLPEFFDRYLLAWNNPADISAFYNEPFIAARMGVLRLNGTRGDTESFFSDVLQKYRARGFAKASRLSLESIPLGANSCLATVRWAYQGPDGNTLWEWTFSYNLYAVSGRWKIILQTLHDE